LKLCAISAFKTPVNKADSPPQARRSLSQRRERAEVLVYNLDHDPSEKWNIAAKHPDVIAEIRRIAEEHKNAIPPVENQLDKRITTTSGK
jgi:C-terminal region of aryl-sulfatase